MEKLIELLNEYENSEEFKKELTDDDYKDIEDIKLEYNKELWIIYWKELTNQLPEAILISKSFWFIKRLVENEKIDLMKLKKWIEDNKFYCAKWGKTTNMLLMLLSISDTPIDDLISYLR